MSSIPTEAAAGLARTLSFQRIPLLLPATGWVAGLVLSRTDLLTIHGAIGVAAVGLLSGMLRSLRPFTLALACGLLWGGASLLWDARDLAVDPSWAVGEQRITAEIVDVRAYPDHRLLRLAGVRRVDGSRLAATVQVSVYGNGRELQSGMHIEARAVLHAPRNAGNPGAFDYRAYCFDRGIVLVGSLRGEVHVLRDDPGWIQYLRRRIDRALSPLPRADQGVLRALLLADRSRIPVAVQDDFAATGTAHLLAISGLHVGMVAAWVFSIVWWFLTRREAWIVTLPVRHVALGAGVIAACTYAMLAGWPLPAERAAMMLAAAAIAWLLRRHTEPANTLLAALLLILAIDPAAIASVSLWLSFAATAGILFVVAGRENGARSGPASWIVAMFAVTVVASLATLPVIAGTFGRLPLYALPANLVAVPLYTFLILPVALFGELLALLGVSAWATACFHVSGAVIDLSDRLLSAMHAWPLGNLWIPGPSAASAAVYVAGMGAALVLAYRGRKLLAVFASVLTLLVWGFWVSAERPPSRMQWIVWDVGQGASSSLIMPDGKVLVMDVPGPEGGLFNGGTEVAAGLRAMGLTHIDVLALSHAQEDHMGGAARLLAQERRIGELWLADVPANHARPDLQELTAQIVARGGQVRWLAQGDRLDFDGSAIRVLWPPRGAVMSSSNNTSLVLSVRPAGQRQRLLWPGDIEAGAESGMLASGLAPHWAMLMPHHGSLTSSGQGFVRALHPAVVIAQTGVGNRYGFPRPAVVRRYEAIGAHVWNTAAGAVFVRWPIGGGEAGVRQFRQGAEGRRERALQWWRGSL